MSKSNVEEIIGILWLIASALTHGWTAAGCAIMCVISMIASLFYTAREIRAEKINGNATI